MKSLGALFGLLKLLFERAFAAFDAYADKKESERRQYERDHLESAPDEFFADHFNGLSDKSDKVATKSSDNKTNT